MIKSAEITITILIFFISIFSCHPKNKTQDSSITPQIIKNLNNAMPEGNFSQNDVQYIIDSLKADMLPHLQGKNREELYSIIQYLDGIKKEMPKYLEHEDNLIKMYNELMQINLLLADAYPNDFDANFNVAVSYVRIASSFGGGIHSPVSINQFKDEYTKKAVESAKLLVEKFPDNPMSYGQLAHTTLVTGGDEKKVVKLLNKCLEVDKKTDYCKEFLKNMENG